MTPPPKPDDQLRQWVENWKRVGPLLEEIRADELGSLDTERALASLEDAFDDALLQAEPRATSGLVELMRLLHRLAA
jgi:hypothetical protein